MFNEEQMACIWLNAYCNIGSRKLRKILQETNPVDILYDPQRYQDYLKAYKAYVYKEAREIRFTKLINYCKTLESQQIGVLLPQDFPEQLNEIADPPGILYYIGNVKLLKNRLFAIVGTRNYTNYGREVTRHFATILAKAGITIVSGLALGLDACAHEAALAAGGTGIGVLGTGIDKEYPSQNRELYKQIKKFGLVVSEYPVGTDAEKYHFPERNRIISGLSEGVLVTEAGEKSGALITARLAVEQNRMLFLVPTNITNPKGMGNNNMLKELQGALVTSPDEIAEAMGISAKPHVPDTLELSYNEEIVLSALRKTECSLEELIEITSLSVSDLNALLITLMVKGLVREADQNRYGVTL